MSDQQVNVVFSFLGQARNGERYGLGDVLRECEFNDVEDRDPVVLLTLGLLPKDGQYVDANGTYVSLKSPAMREAVSLFLVATSGHLA